MTSKLYQRCLIVFTVVAILALLVIIVVVWLEYGNADKTQTGKYNATVDVETSSDTSTSFEKHKDLPISLEGPKKSSTKQNNVQYVMPWKLNTTPVQDLNFQYDHHNNNSISDIPIRHHSGHFRHRTAETWDLQPQYEIQAFGNDFHLELIYNDEHIYPGLYIIHFTPNYTQRMIHDARISGCFYTGKVKGDQNSAVVVSLCHGMTGYIHTSTGNFQIEPVEQFQNGSTSLLHRFTKITDKYQDAENKSSGEQSHCETQDPSAIDEEIIHESVKDVHFRKKREVLYFDYTEDTDDYLYDPYSNDYRRTARQIKKSMQNIRRKRTGKEYFIEILMVADRTMLQYHKTEENVVRYILTLMSHVSLLFKDATIGNPISLAVVKIFIDSVTDYRNISMHEILKEFCQWQKNNSMLNIKHDAAVLLRRSPICRNASTGACYTLGIAEVGAMCSEKSSCALVRDNGLSTSYIIAHELGHLLNMRHDESNPCRPINQGQTIGIMNTSLKNNSAPWRWTACSRHYVTEFLDSSRSSCLLDKPDINEIQQINLLPGEKYEADRQCELEFGSGSKVCPTIITNVENICKELWCTGAGGICQSQHMPWAEGTKCAFDSWCHNSQCVWKDRMSISPVNGLWGPWQEWSSCSRSCGGGIKISKRHCNAPAPKNGGEYCKGESSQYASCDTKDCPVNIPTFRELQCSDFDGQTNGVSDLTTEVKWVPKKKLPQPEDHCKLVCQVKNNSTKYYTFKNKVLDGTKCGTNGFGICINGVCRPGGCDNKLNSDKSLDECGICDGDNSTCQEVSGHYNYSCDAQHTFREYTKIVRIPKGSFNIVIQQIAFQNNTKNDSYLVLVDGETGTDLINKHYVISSFPKTIEYAGLEISYSGSDSTIETVITSRYQKLEKDLIVEVLNLCGNPPDIYYKYMIENRIAPKYGWHLYDTNWTECNAICNGKQTMLPICVDLDSGVHVGQEYCSDLSLHKKEIDCNTNCNLVWNGTRTGSCSERCGEGVQEIAYNCVVVNSNMKKDDKFTYNVANYGVPVDDWHCSKIQKRPRFETCYGPCDSSRWIYSNWTQCSKTCAGGIQTREATCVDTHNSTIDDYHCQANVKKDILQPCNVGRCPIWSYSDWSACSVPCGKGVRSRAYYCTIGGEVINQNSCNINNLRATKEECEVAKCQWFVGAWNACSSSCGDGVQTREVSCRANNEMVKENYCKHLLKPENRKICDYSKPCDVIKTRIYHVDNNEINDENYNYFTFKWEVGPWTKCSKSCESGIRSRQVVCRDSTGKTNEEMCDVLKRPDEHERCNEFACPKWVHGEYGSCTLNCEKRRQVGCQDHNGKIVHGDHCNIKIKPTDRMKCQACMSVDHKRKTYVGHDKKNYRWKKSRWLGCSSSCGNGTQFRKVSCRDLAKDVTVVDSFCYHTRKPKHVRLCEYYNKFNCSYTWSEGVWSKCSKQCNEGIRHRNVTCHKVLPGEMVQRTAVHSMYCNYYLKPPAQERCIKRKCDDEYEWTARPWQKCSELCGRNGIQTRKLECNDIKQQRRVPKRHCPKESRPERKRKCNRFPCYKNCKEIKEKLNNSTNEDYLLHINGKLATIYCYKMDTQHPEEFITLEPGRENYAEFFDKRLNRPNTCKAYANPNHCDCADISTKSVGRTTFWKVRLNITTMKIITDDFTFSASEKNQQRYGHAGDCYSEVSGCIEGKFSVDLRGTTFKVSKTVTWYSHGISARSNINFNNPQLVFGRCGGNCGSCLPDPLHGLLVEVT